MCSYAPIDLENKLRESLKNVEFINIIDESDGCGGKFVCVIVSTDFEGMPTLARHRMVNGILAEELKSIHAFSQKPMTPEQYQKFIENK